MARLKVAGKSKVDPYFGGEEDDYTPEEWEDIRKIAKKKKIYLGSLEEDSYTPEEWKRIRGIKILPSEYKEFLRQNPKIGR